MEIPPGCTSKTTLHGRSNAFSLLHNALRDESNGRFSVFYWNKTKAIRYAQSRGLKLPNGLLRDGFIHSMTESASPVNTKFESQTQTQQFKRWFRKSMIINADGTPMILYHQTGSIFYEFDISRDGAGATDSETPHAGQRPRSG